MKGFNTNFIRKRNKYGAIKTVIDGITFDSKAEAKRYSELRILERAKEISNLLIHPKKPLYAFTPEDNMKPIGFYIPDFFYFDKTRQGMPVYEDVKGVSTSTYKLKKKIFEANYGIKITEITK